MKQNRFTLTAYASTAVGLTLVGPGQVIADDLELQEIIVTARRVEERLQDVPISIAVFKQEELAARNVSTLSDLALYTPSLSSNETFGSDNARYQIRGFVQELDTAPSVGIYFADVVAPRAGANSVPAGNGAGPGSLFDLQNVQVLKGPQGTLFGRNTTGGAILMVPQKPTDSFEGYGEVSAGNYEMQRFQGVVNFPIADSVRMRLGVDTQQRDGWLHNRSGVGPKDLADIKYTAARASLVVDVTPNIENYTIGSFSHSNNNGTTQKLVECDPSAPDPFAALACAQLARPGQSDFYDVMQAASDPHSETEQWQLINTTTWNASDELTIKNIASYAEYKQSLFQELFGQDFRSTDSDPTLPLRHYGLQIGSLGGDDLTHQSSFTEEFQLQGRAFDSKLTWQAGAYYELSKPIGESGTQSPTFASCTDYATLQCSDPARYAIANFPPAIAGTRAALTAANPPIQVAPGVFVPFLSLPAAAQNGVIRGALLAQPAGQLGLTNTDAEFEDYAVYSQATYQVTDSFKVTGGFRYTWDRLTNSTYAEANTFPANGGAATVRCTDAALAYPNCTRNFRTESSAPTWVVDLVYAPISEFMAYAKYARGYRSGAIAANVPVPEVNYIKPEKVDVYELGFKSSFNGAVRGTFNASIFYNDFVDQQIQVSFVPKTTGLPRSASAVNAGKSEIYGAEVEASLVPVEGLVLQASYAYLKTEIKSVYDLSYISNAQYDVRPRFAVGDPLILSPENQYSFIATYTLPLPEQVGRVWIGGIFTHKDEVLSNYNSRLSASPNLRKYSYLPATDLVNLNAGWDSIMGTNLDVALFATNLTEEEYYTFSPGLALNGGYEAAGLGEPRMYGMRLKYRFGN